MEKMTRQWALALCLAEAVSVEMKKTDCSWPEFHLPRSVLCGICRFIGTDNTMAQLFARRMAVEKRSSDPKDPTVLLLLFAMTLAKSFLADYRGERVVREQDGKKETEEEEGEDRAEPASSVGLRWQNAFPKGSAGHLAAWWREGTRQSVARAATSTYATRSQTPSGGPSFGTCVSCL
jgi:hypothetical protein